MVKLDREKDQVGLRDFISLILLILSSKFSDMTTTLYYAKALNASWIAVVMSFLFVLPSLIILNRILNKYETKNLMDLLNIAFGKYIGFFIGMIFLIIVIIANAVDTRSYVNQLMVMNFPKTPLFILYFVFTMICFWAAKKGWEAIAAVAWMVVPYIKLLMLLLVILLFTNGEPSRTFPLFGPGKWELIKTSFQYAGIYGDLIFIAFLYPFVKSNKTYSKGIYISSAIAVAELSLFFWLYSLVFDFRTLEKITYPFNEATRFVTLGPTITNIETIYLTFWLIAVFIKFAIYMYVMSKVFGDLFRINEFEHTLFPLTILVLFMGMYPDNQTENVHMIRDTLLIYSKYVFLVVPPLIWLTLKTRGKVGN